MTQLSAIINDDTISGVYCLDPRADIEKIRETAAQWGLQTKALEGKEIPDKKSLLTRMGELLNFPDYYGENWDALEDCLSDYFSDPKTSGVALVYRDSGHFHDNAPEEFNTLLDILKEITLLCETQPNAFVVLLQGIDPEKLGLPQVEV